MSIPDGHTKAQLINLANKHVAYVGFPPAKDEPRVLIWKGKAYRREGRAEDGMPLYTQIRCYMVPDDHGDT